jgi:leader peptidase (prepilin peptidase) / N-methyltransferase
MYVSTMYEIFLPLLVGWIIGAIINYLTDTLPTTRQLSKPLCQVCGTPMMLTNYFLWPRRCNSCGNSRPWRVWIVELFFIISSMWLWENFPPSLGYWTGIVLLAYFILVTIIDLEHRLILHITSIAGLIFGLWVGIQLHGIVPTLIGGATGFFLMLGLYYSGFLYLRISRKLRGEVPKEIEALGFGDVNLSGIIGLILGWPGILLGLILAILLAGFVSLLYLLYLIALHKYHPDSTLPYGPFLAISAVILLYLRNILF